MTANQLAEFRRVVALWRELTGPGYVQRLERPTETLFMQAVREAQRAFGIRLDDDAPHECRAIGWPAGKRLHAAIVRWSGGEQ